MNVRVAVGETYFPGDDIRDSKYFQPAKDFCNFIYPERKLGSWGDVGKLTVQTFDLDTDSGTYWLWMGRYLACKYPEKYEEWKNGQT